MATNNSNKSSSLPRGWRERSIRSRLYFALEDNLYKDVNFLVGPEGEVISAHKLILRLSSPFFETLINSLEYKGDNTIKFPEICPKVFKRLMKFIYTDEIEPFDLSNFFDLASSFGFHWVVKLISETIKGKGDLSLDKVVFALQVATHQNDREWRMKCLGFIRRNAETMFNKTESFVFIPKPELEEILAHDQLEVVDEITVFKGVMKWAKYQCEEQSLPLTKENIKEVLGDELRMKIRYPHITYDKMLADVKESGVLTGPEFLTALRTTMDPQDNPLRLNTKKRDSTVMIAADAKRQLEELRKKDTIKRTAPPREPEIDPNDALMRAPFKKVVTPRSEQLTRSHSSHPVASCPPMDMNSSNGPYMDQNGSAVMHHNSHHDHHPHPMFGPGPHPPHFIPLHGPGMGPVGPPMPFNGHPEIPPQHFGPEYGPDPRMLIPPNTDFTGGTGIIGPLPSPPPHSIGPLPHNPPDMSNSDTEFLLQSCTADFGYILSAVQMKSGTVRSISLINVTITNFSLPPDDPQPTTRLLTPCLTFFEFRRHLNPAVMPVTQLPDKTSFLGPLSIRDFLFFEKTGARWVFSSLPSMGIEVCVAADGVKFMEISKMQEKLVLAYPESEVGDFVLENCPFISTLCLTGCGIKSPSRLPVQNVKNMVLYGVECNGMSLIRLLNKCINLTTLSYWDIKTNQGQHFSQFHVASDLVNCRQTLESLAVTRVFLFGLTAKGVRKSYSSPFSKLEELYINCCEWNADFINHFTLTFPSLKRLGIRSLKNKRPSIAFLRKVTETLKDLEFLAISRQRNEHFYDNVPNMTFSASVADDIDWLKQMNLLEPAFQLVPGAVINIPDFMVKKDMGKWEVVGGLQELEQMHLQALKCEEFFESPEILNAIPV